MVIGSVVSAFAAVFMVGMIALIVRRSKRSELKKHTSGRPMEVRFRRKGLLGVGMFVFTLWAGLWTALHLAMNIDRPSYYFSLGFTALFIVVYFSTVKRFGEMFVVCEVGKATPSRSVAPPKQKHPVPATTPGYYTPGYHVPVYTTPVYESPENKAPDYTSPSYQTPDYTSPEYQAPDYKSMRPDYQTPDLKSMGPDGKNPGLK